MLLVQTSNYLFEVEGLNERLDVECFQSQGLLSVHHEILQQQHADVAQEPVAQQTQQLPNQIHVQAQLQHVTTYNGSLKLYAICSRIATEPNVR